ncbi:MAG: sigma-70 family RNA polymerase sigma factor [Planctomycetota bacterium]|nr:sigma-70 family RNA polymerase sigma factor [Planctomycetota bacterium]
MFDSHSKLAAAKLGDSEAKGELLDRFRPYLNVIAQRLLDDRLKGRMDSSDVVQATYLEASRDFGAFRGDTIESFLSWLRHILRNNVSTAHQEHLATQKRSARLEVNIRPTGNSSSDPMQFEQMIPSDASSPSQRLMRSEAAALLAACIEQLPLTQQEAIRMKYLEGLSLKAISERINKSEMAVAGLLKRGLQGLREHMAQARAGNSSFW